MNLDAIPPKIKHKYFTLNFFIGAFVILCYWVIIACIVAFLWRS